MYMCVCVCVWHIFYPEKNDVEINAYRITESLLMNHYGKQCDLIHSKWVRRCRLTIVPDKYEGQYETTQMFGLYYGAATAPISGNVCACDTRVYMRFNAYVIWITIK